MAWKVLQFTEVKNIVMTEFKLTNMTTSNPRETRHPKCAGYYDEMNGDYDCHYYTSISCEECKYGCGRKNPEAKCNQIK